MPPRAPGSRSPVHPNRPHPVPDRRRRRSSRSPAAVSMGTTVHGTILLIRLSSAAATGLPIHRPDAGRGQPCRSWLEEEWRRPEPLKADPRRIEARDRLSPRTAARPRDPEVAGLPQGEMQRLCSRASRARGRCASGEPPVESLGLADHLDKRPDQLSGGAPAGAVARARQRPAAGARRRADRQPRLQELGAGLPDSRRGGPTRAARPWSRSPTAPRCGAHGPPAPSDRRPARGGGRAQPGARKDSSTLM